MDTREASGMTEASGLTTDQDGVDNASESIPGRRRTSAGARHGLTGIGCMRSPTGCAN